jgi:uncharacterized protein (TIRG00374 family)
LKKKILSNTLRVVISVGLLIYLVLLADIKNIYNTLKIVDLRYFGLAILFFLICVMLLTVRWRLLLKQLKINHKFKLLANFYLIGYFFNNFLPTTIGGDVSRAYNVARVSGQKADSVGSILLERMMGLLATLTLASISMFWVIQYFHTPRIIFLTIALLLGIIFILANILIPSTFKFTSTLLKKIKIFTVGEKIQKVLSSIHSYRENKKIILFAYLISLVSQFTLIMMNFILAKALNLDKVTLGYLFIVVPVTFILGLFPSVNGLGVRDSGYVFLLTRIGLSPAEALSLSVLNTLVPVLVSLYGGLLLIFYRHKKEIESLEEMKAELE